MKDSLVSVCINTYNRKHILPSTLKSVLKQTYRNIEIIIVDDFSTDGTKQLVVNEFLKLDKRIRYIRHNKNKGLAAGRNSAIFSARGKYFTFCDDDDQWLPDYIEKFVSVAKNYNENWCFCCGGTYLKNKKKIKHIYRQKNLKLKQAILKGYTPPVAGQFYFTKTLKKCQGYNENIKSGVDHDLWLTLSYNNLSIYFLSSPLAMPNSNENIERMTNKFQKRSSKIEKSLKIWKKDFQNFYGQIAYQKFCNQYKFDIFQSFLIQYLKQKKILKIVELLFYQKNFILLPKAIKNIFLKVINRKKTIITIKPYFKIN